MHKFKKIFLISLFASITVTNAVYANCNAIINNSSNQTWIVKFNTIRGKVYFPGMNCEGNGPCWVAPHSQLNLEYTYNTGYAAGAIHLKDMQGNQKTFAYAAKSEQCPRIEHAGNIEGVKLNDPWAGNIQIMNDAW